MHTPKAAALVLLLAVCASNAKYPVDEGSMLSAHGSSGDWGVGGSAGASGGGGEGDGTTTGEDFAAISSSSCLSKCGMSYDDNPAAPCFCDTSCAFYNGRHIPAERLPSHIAAVYALNAPCTDMQAHTQVFCLLFFF